MQQLQVNMYVCGYFRAAAVRAAAAPSPKWFSHANIVSGCGAPSPFEFYSMFTVDRIHCNVQSAEFILTDSPFCSNAFWKHFELFWGPFSSSSFLMRICLYIRVHIFMSGHALVSFECRVPNAIGPAAIHFVVFILQRKSSRFNEYSFVM
jgi:hypothetical protein